MAFREIEIRKGVKIILGKDAKSNDELMKKYEGKENKIVHTVAPGSPFCVIDASDPSKKDVKNASGACAYYSQDWRDNKQDTTVNVFTGKDISKTKGMKPGTWKVSKSKKIVIKKRKIERVGDVTSKNS